MHACPGGIGPVAPSPFPFPHVPFPRVPLLCPHSTSPMPGSHCCAFCPRSSLHSPAFTSVKLQHVLCCGSGLSYLVIVLKATPPDHVLLRCVDAPGGSCALPWTDA